MANNDNVKTFTVNLNIADEKYKKQLQNIAKETGAAMKQVSDTEVELRFSEHVKNFDRVLDAVKRFSTEASKYADIRFAIDTEGLKKDADKAAKEIDKLVKAKLMKTRGDASNTGIFSLDAGGTSATGTVKNAEQTVKKYAAAVGLATNANKELTKSEQDKITKMLEAQKVATGKGGKYSDTTLKEAQKEINYLNIREEALKRIAALEETTNNGKKLFELDSDSVIEYTNLLKLVSTIESRMASGKRVEGTGSPLLSQFKEFTATDFTTKIKEANDAITNLSTEYRGLITQFKESGGANIGIFDSDMALKFVNELDKQRNSLEQVFNAMMGIVQAEKEVGEAGEQGMGDTAEAAENAGQKIDEAAEKARKANAEFEKLKEGGALTRIAETQPHYGNGIDSKQKSVQDLVANVSGSVQALKESKSLDLKDVETTYTHIQDLLDMIDKSLESIKNSEARATDQAKTYAEYVAATKKDLEGYAAELDKIKTQLGGTSKGEGNGVGNGTGSGSGEGGKGEGQGKGEHAGPLYTQADVEESRVNLSNTYKDISDIVSKIKDEILSQKLSLSLDKKIFTDIEEVYTKLDALRERISSLSLETTGPTQVPTQSQSQNQPNPSDKIIISSELNPNTELHLKGELAVVITELQKLTIYLNARLNPGTVQPIVDEVNNLINLLSIKGPIRIDARLAEQALEHVRNDIKSITTSVGGTGGKSIPVDIEVSSNSAKAMEDRISSIVQKVNQAVTDSKTIDVKNAVNIPAKVESISKIVGNAVKEYNSSEHPSHVIKLQASITKTALMSKVKEAVGAVNASLVEAKTGGVKVPVKTDSSKTLKDSSLKNTEELLDNIKEKYSNIEINIKLAKNNDIDKINEVFTKIKDALNQVNKSGGVKIIYNTNGDKNGTNIIERSADEEKAMKSLNSELEKLTKSYRDFQNTNALFSDAKTKDTQEAQALKTEVADLYKNLTTLDTSQLDSHSLTQLLDQFEQKLSEAKIRAKDSYSSITSEIDKTAKATEKLIAESENYTGTVTGNRIDKLVTTPSLQENYDTSAIDNLKTKYDELKAAIQAVQEAKAKGSDMSDAVKGYEDAKKALEDYYKSLEKVEKETPKVETAKSWGNIDGLEAAKAKIEEVNHSLGSFDRQSLKAEKGVYTLNYAIQEQDGILKTITYKYDTASKELIRYGESEKKVVSIGERFSAMLKERGMSLVAYLGTFASFYRLVGVMRDGINVIHEVDTAFTELRKVAQESDDQLKSFANTMAFDIAGEIGNTGKNIINLTADFERLGYALSDAQNLAKDTAVLMNVGDMENSEDAMQSLVSTMKGFNLTAEDSSKIVDEFNEIGNRFSISTEGISQAMQRSSAALAQANNSLEQSLALAVAANDAIQDPQQVGNTLKVVALRIRGKIFVPIYGENYSPCYA